MSNRHGIAAAILVILAWVWSAIGPLNLEAWILEQVATLLALATLFWCHRGGVRFNPAAIWCIAIMLMAHTIGTHYTYSLTPYDALFSQLFGTSLNDLLGWERNNYDRFVHLLYGLTMVVPVSQALAQRLRLAERSADLLSFHIVLSTSAIYELMEWAAALSFGHDLGNRYLGTQGDIWDAQADMALAGGGAAVVYLLRWTRRRTGHR